MEIERAFSFLAEERKGSSARDFMNLRAGQSPVLD